MNCNLSVGIDGSSSLQNNFHHNDHSQQQHQNQCQQIVLCAPNPRERKLWLRAIRKVLYLHYGGGQLFIFEMIFLYFIYLTVNFDLIPK